MRRVVGYVHRHQVQKPPGDVEDSTWRYSLIDFSYATVGAAYPDRRVGPQAGGRLAPGKLEPCRPKAGLRRLADTDHRLKRRGEPIDTDKHGGAEEAHPHGERRFYALAEHALDIVMVTGPDGTIRYLSPSVERVLGYMPEEMLGTNSADYVHPDDLERAFGELQALLSKPGMHPAAVETRVRHKDGSWRHLEGMATNLLDDPAVEGLVFNQRDVTDRVRAEKEVRRLNSELEGRVAGRTAQLEAALGELRENEERFRATFEQAAVGIAHVGVDGGWLRVNRKLCDIVGYPRKELLELGFQDITHPEDLKTDLDYLRRLLAGEIGTYSMEKRYFRKGGSVVWVNLTVSLVRGDSGEAAYLIAVIEDISRRKRAEEALRASEARFRTVIEQSPLSTQFLSPDGRTLRVNRAFEDLWGLALEDLREYNMLEDPQLVEKGIMPYIRKGFAGEPAAIPPIAYDPEQTIPGLSSHKEPVRWVQGFIYPVKDEAGDVREVVLVHEDVTERKEGEERLRESEARYRAVVEQCGEGIFLFEPEPKRVLESNPAFQKMFGYDEEELRRTTLYDLVPQDTEGVDRNVARAIERGYLVVGERSYRRKDGSRVDVEVSGGAISYRGKEVICSVVRDITERKRAEEAIEQVREAERSRMARDLHDGVLQDLSYTAAAMEVTGMKIEDAGLAQELSKETDYVRRAVDGLRRAIYDLRSGDERSRPLPQLLEALVEQSRTMAPAADISLIVGEGVPQEPFGEKGTQLLRIFQEALSNVRRHSDAGSVRVALGIEGDDLVAEVSDDGRGFVLGGSGGVGLSSMRERAAGLGGGIEVESEPGAGTRVRLRVPLPRIGTTGHG